MEWLEALTVIDIVIVAVLLVALAIGWARGLVELLTGFVVFTVATIVAGRYAGEVLDILNRTWGLRERLAGVLERRINLPPEAYKVPAASIPWHKALEWLQYVPIPEEYRQTLAHRLSEWSATAGTKTAAAFVIQELAEGVLEATVFILLTMVIGWFFALLGRLVSDQIKEIPLAGTTNRLLGAAATVTETAVVIALLVGLVAPVVSMYGGQVFGSAVANARLTPYFLELFGWLRGLVFGVGGERFFTS